MCIRDRDVPYHYNKVNVAREKKENKMALQKELGLTVDPNVMLVGAVSRLTWQKGFYLMMEKLSEICAMPIQVAILGSGESGIDVYKRQLPCDNKRRSIFYGIYKWRRDAKISKQR